MPGGSRDFQVGNRIDPRRHTLIATFGPVVFYAFAILPFASTDETPMPVEAFRARNRSSRACSPEWLRTHVRSFDVTADDEADPCATSRPHAKQLCRKGRPNFKGEKLPVVGCQWPVTPLAFSRGACPARLSLRRTPLQLGNIPEGQGVVVLHRQVTPTLQNTTVHEMAVDREH